MQARCKLPVRKLGACQQKRRLRTFLVFFLTVLTIPLGFLIERGYQQAQKEQHVKYLWHGQHVVKQLNDYLSALLQVEENRPAGDYHFYKLNDETDPEYNQLTLSPLASIPDPTLLPGIIGYFQVDEAGLYSCPLLPLSDNESLIKESQLGSTKKELELKKRLQLRNIIRPLLIENGFINVPEHNSNPEELTSEFSEFIYDGAEKAPQKNTPILIRIESLQLKQDKSGHFIFFRNVWRGDSKLVQGFVVNHIDFLIAPLKGLLKNADFDSDIDLQLMLDSQVIGILSYTHNLENNSVGYHDQTTKTTEANNTAIEIYTANLFGPLSSVTLGFTTNKLPLSPKTLTASFVLLIFIIIILSGLIFIYRLAAQQIHLNEDRLNFVSAVSHELRTPLTSIIMYADMLREGIVRDEEKKSKYYNYIYLEGERLGRLIANVLRFSKLGRDISDITLEYTSIRVALDLIQSKVSTLVENTNFQLNIKCDKDTCENSELLIDKDAFTQIAINLIDNAIKFSDEASKSDPARRRIDVYFTCDKTEPGHLCFSVRDYGPGIDNQDEKYIFDIFYRAGQELTRKTKGTGIGLALVKELTRSMNGSVSFKRHQPGVEFRVCIPYKKAG